MRFPTLAAVAVVSLSLSGVARAEDEDAHVPPLERAERLERKGRELLEKGHKVDGARLVSQAWHMRARVWAAEARAKDHPREEAKAPEAAREAHAKAVTELRVLDLRLQDESEDIKAHPWKLLDKERAEELVRVRQEHERALLAVKKGQIEANRHETRRKVAHLKERSEDLERKAKKAREEGRHDDAREKMRMSGETWAEARELERALERHGHGQSDALPDPRGPGDRPPGVYDGFERFTGYAGRHDAKREHAAPGVPPRPPAPPFPPGGLHGVADVRAQVESLREDVRRLRELVESLREHLQKRAEGPR